MTATIEAPETAVDCRCGRRPEWSTDGRWGREPLALVCKCGGDVASFLVRSRLETRCVDNWNSLIQQKPFRHYVQHMARPEDQVSVAWSGGDYYDTDPLRRYVRATGGHCSGGGGAC